MSPAFFLPRALSKRHSGQAIGQRPSGPNRTSSNQTEVMKPKRNPITLMLGWLALAVAPLHGMHGAENPTGTTASQNTGTIEGRVQNEVTGRYLR